MPAVPAAAPRLPPRPRPRPSLPQMDIESYEFPVIASWSERSAGLPLQLSVEVHYTAYWGQGALFGRPAFGAAELALFFGHLANLVRRGRGGGGGGWGGGASRRLGGPRRNALLRYAAGACVPYMWVWVVGAPLQVSDACLKASTWPRMGTRAWARTHLATCRASYMRRTTPLLVQGYGVVSREDNRGDRTGCCAEFTLLRVEVPTFPGINVGGGGRGSGSGASGHGGSVHAGVVGGR